MPVEWITEVPQGAGSALIFTEALTHCTLPWTAPYERRDVLFKYSPPHLAFKRWQDPPRAVWRSLSDEQRRLMQPPAMHPHDPV